MNDRHGRNTEQNSAYALTNVSIFEIAMTDKKVLRKLRRAQIKNKCTKCAVGIIVKTCDFGQCFICTYCGALEMP